MREITSPAALYTKAALILIRTPALSTAVLLAIAIWAFARVYYFAFYVIEELKRTNVHHF